MENTITYDGNKMTIEKQNPSVTVSKTGVVNIMGGCYYDSITVNSENMIETLQDAVSKMVIKPVVDNDRKFAGRVTITVEFLGDMKEENMLEDGSGS